MADLTIVRVPDLQYMVNYFPEIFAQLRRWSRVNVPEITNEDLREIFIQLERAFSLMAHYNAVLTDMLANEMFLSTANLPESVKLLLELIDYRMLPASPAQVELLGEMNRTYSSTIRILEANRKFATRRTASSPEIVFENLTAIDLANRTDQITDAFGLQLEKSGTGDLSSIFPDLVEWKTGSKFVTADLGKYMEIESTLGNTIDKLRITELVDEDPGTPGEWFKARLQTASFITEAGVTWKIYDQTSNGASTINGGSPFTIFPTSIQDGDLFYFGHTDILWNRFDVTLNVVAAGIVAVWEFYDNTDTTFHPDAVTVDPPGGTGRLRFNLSSILGTDDVSHAVVRVMYIATGYEFTNHSEFISGVNVVDVIGYMGQGTPSTNIADYLIFINWRPINISEDATLVGSVTWASNGKIEFTLPQTTDDNWKKYTFYDRSATEERQAYYLRYRIIDVTTPTGPRPQGIDLTKGNQYQLVTLTQGRLVEDRPLGSSSGEASQEFILTQGPYINRSLRVFVDEGGGDIEWIPVSTLLTSQSTDRHYKLNLQSDGFVTISFGDGTYGKIPPIGTNNISALYRIGASENGNIGANTLTVNRDGVGVYRTVTNPRSGQYWVEADWNSVAALERVKESGPLNLRTMYRSVTDKDAEILAKSYTNSAGVKPVLRAKAYEEAFGPKTVEIVVVGQGGSALSQEYKDELEEFFNGGPTYDGILVLNYEATVSNYVPRQIALTVTVTARDIVTEKIILQTLANVLSPAARESDGVTFVWRFGQEVPLARISAEIFKVSPGNVFNVEFASPTVDIQLSNKELPTFDQAGSNITIIPPEFD